MQGEVQGARVVLVCRGMEDGREREEEGGTVEGIIGELVLVSEDRVLGLD